MAIAVMAGLVAPDASAEGWSAMSGQTLGTGAGMVWGQAGWPGISADLAYGDEPHPRPRRSLHLQLRRGGHHRHRRPGARSSSSRCGPSCSSKPKFDLALRFDPGLLLYFPSNTTVVGLTFPVGLELGFPISPVVRVNGSFDLPFWITFSPSPTQG